MSKVVEAWLIMWGTQFRSIGFRFEDGSRDVKEFRSDDPDVLKLIGKLPLSQQRLVQDEFPPHYPAARHRAGR